LALEKMSFVGLLAAAPEAPAGLADTDFDAAALRAGAFLVVVLVAVFATGETLLMSCHSRHCTIGKVVADQD
jgi:TctA family transporter